MMQVAHAVTSVF